MERKTKIQFFEKANSMLQNASVILSELNSTHHHKEEGSYNIKYMGFGMAQIVEQK